MLCDYCGINKANVHLIKIIDNEIEKINLCSECAQQISMGSEQDILEGLADILVKMFAQGKKDTNRKPFRALKESHEVDTKCSNCGIDLSTIKKTGKVGCAQCYKEFSEIFLPLLEAIHGSIEYKGKIPLNSSFTYKVEKKIKDLKSKLDEAVIIENFEEAAKLRDMIKRLRKRLYVKSKK